MRLSYLVHLGLCVSLVACANTPDSSKTPSSDTKPAPTSTAAKPVKSSLPKPKPTTFDQPSSLNLQAMQGSWGLLPEALPFVVIEGQNFRWAKENISYPLQIQGNALVGRVPGKKQNWSDSCLVNITMRGVNLTATPSECTKGKIKKNASITFFKVAAHPSSTKESVSKPAARVVAKPSMASNALSEDLQAMQGTWTMMGFSIFSIQGSEVVLVANKVVSKLQPVGNTLQGKMQDPRGNLCDAVIKLKKADALEVTRSHCLDKDKQPITVKTAVFYRQSKASAGEANCSDIVKKRTQLQKAMQKAALGSDQRLQLAAEYLQAEQSYKDKLCALKP
jgi:hypothetical protein